MVCHDRCTGAPPRPNMDVLVEGERILRVVPDAELEPALRAKANAPRQRRYITPSPCWTGHDVPKAH